MTHAWVNAMGDGGRKRQRPAQQSRLAFGGAQGQTLQVRASPPPKPVKWQQHEDVFWAVWPEKSEESRLKEAAGDAAAEGAAVYAFDFDDTIVERSSKSARAREYADHPPEYVTNKLRALAAEPRNRLVVFSNQRGVTTNHTTLEEVMTRLERAMGHLNVPIVVMFATKSSIYRKPRRGMWDLYLEKVYPAHLPLPNLGTSIYVGDAAGRPRGGPLARADHADSDLKFALNCKLPFEVPEVFFRGLKSDFSTVFDFDPGTLGGSKELREFLPGPAPQAAKAAPEAAETAPEAAAPEVANGAAAAAAASFAAPPAAAPEGAGAEALGSATSLLSAGAAVGREALPRQAQGAMEDEPQLPVSGGIDVSAVADAVGSGAAQGASAAPELVLMCGPPGVGKTWVARRAFAGTHAWVNGDAHGGDAKKCMKIAEQRLAEGESVVLDFLNATREQRARWLALGKKYGARAVAVELRASKKYCFHNNLFRSLTSEGPESRTSVPLVVLHKFFNDYVAPSKAEGFERIVVIPAEELKRGPFKSLREEQLYYSHLF